MSESRQLVRDINHVRVDHGLGELSYSWRISFASKRWSREMASHHELHHHVLPVNRTWGEILYVGSGGTQNAVRAWLDSPPHRAVMLSPAFGSVGAGKAVDRGRTYWTTRFGGR